MIWLQILLRIKKKTKITRFYCDLIRGKSEFVTRMEEIYQKINYSKWPTKYQLSARVKNFFTGSTRTKTLLLVRVLIVSVLIFCNFEFNITSWLNWSQFKNLLNEGFQFILWIRFISYSKDWSWRNCVFKFRMVFFSIFLELLFINFVHLISFF